VSEESRAQVRAEAAERQLERLRTGATWLSAQELDQAKTEARMAGADLQSARAAVGVGRAQLQQQVIQSKRRTLHAPFDGKVVELGIDPGDSVTPGQLLMRVLSDEREVRFAAPPNELPPAGSAGRVLIKLSGTDVVVAAEISALRPELDPSAQLVFASVPLPGVLPQPERFMPGAPVQVFLAP
jgi:multidrug efflux pump subunit AcrA (membrane-fusion protein)